MLASLKMGGLHLGCPRCDGDMKTGSPTFSRVKLLRENVWSPTLVGASRSRVWGLRFTIRKQGSVVLRDRSDVKPLEERQQTRHVWLSTA